MKTQHGIAPHLKCACCVLQSHRPECVPPVAKETQSISRLRPLPPSPPPPPSMWTSGLSMTWNKSRWWKNTAVVGASAAPCQSRGPGIKCQRRRERARGTAGACLKWTSAWLLCIHAGWFDDPWRYPRGRGRDAAIKRIDANEGVLYQGKVAWLMDVRDSSAGTWILPWQCTPNINHLTPDTQWRFGRKQQE